MKMVQTARRDTKVNIRENADVVAACMRPTDIWVMGRPAQDEGKLITSKEFARV